MEPTSFQEHEGGPDDPDGDYSDEDDAPATFSNRWLKGQRVEQHILWLYGYAGSGKSAIPQAVTEHFAGRKRLLASFFFFRGSGDRGLAVRFAATIAAQMAASLPATAVFIEAAIEAHPGLMTSSDLETQFQLLVLEPFMRALTSCDECIKNTVLIVIDGFDECGDREYVAYKSQETMTRPSRSSTPPSAIFC